MARLRALPWARILAIAQVVVARVGEDISAKDRQRLAGVVRKSKGNPRALSAGERREVLRILRQVDFPRLGRDVATAAAAAGLLKRRR